MESYGRALRYTEHEKTWNSAVNGRKAINLDAPMAFGHGGVQKLDCTLCLIGLPVAFFSHRKSTNDLFLKNKIQYNFLQISMGTVEARCHINIKYPIWGKGLYSSGAIHGPF